VSGRECPACGDDMSTNSYGGNRYTGTPIRWYPNQGPQSNNDRVSAWLQNLPPPGHGFGSQGRGFGRNVPYPWR